MIFKHTWNLWKPASSTLHSQIQEMSQKICLLRSWPLACNPVTTGQTHLDIFKCTSEYPCHQKSLISHGNNHSSCWPVLRCHSSKQPQDGSKDQHLEHIAHYWLDQKFCSLFTIRCHDRDNFHFPSNNGTKQPLDNVVTVCSTALCHLSSYFTVPSSHNTVPFQTRELFQVSSAVFQGRKISFQ